MSGRKGYLPNKLLDPTKGTHTIKSFILATAARTCLGFQESESPK